MLILIIKERGGVVGTDINFVPENCLKSYYATVAKRIDLNRFKWLQTIYMKCTVYQDIKNDRGLQYFTVDEITYTKNDLPKIDDIRPFIYLKKVPDEDNRRWFTNAAPNDCVLYITPKKALMQTSDHKYHNFIFSKHIESRSGYIDLYKNGNESFELNINRIFDDSTSIAVPAGKMTVTINHVTTSFRIAGLGDDTHHHSTNYTDN
jgi:hypothetical protein